MGELEEKTSTIQVFEAKGDGAEFELVATFSLRTVAEHVQKCKQLVYDAAEKCFFLGGQSTGDANKARFVARVDYVESPPRLELASRTGVRTLRRDATDASRRRRGSDAMAPTLTSRRGRGTKTRRGSVARVTLDRPRYLTRLGGNTDNPHIFTTGAGHVMMLCPRFYARVDKTTGALLQEVATTYERHDEEHITYDPSRGAIWYATPRRDGAAMPLVATGPRRRISRRGRGAAFRDGSAMPLFATDPRRRFSRRGRGAAASRRTRLFAGTCQTRSSTSATC